MAIEGVGYESSGAMDTTVTSRVVQGSENGGRPSHGQPLTPVGPVSLEALPLAHHWGKRAFDLAFSLLLLLLAAPLMLIIALLVKIDSSGPVLFPQERIGLNGIPFRMLKFRTMKPHCTDDLHRQYVSDLIQHGTAYEQGSSDAVYKVTDDPRITRLGRLLRKLCLDELPQFWNVLRGEMSVVGPRPPLPYEVAQYTERHWARLTGRPGITGLWQVSGRSRLSFEQMVDLDLEYLGRWSFGLDLWIIVRTVPEILGFSNNGF